MLGIAPPERASAKMSTWTRDTLPWRGLFALPWWAQQGDTAAIQRTTFELRRLSMRSAVELAAQLSAASGYMAMARRDTLDALRHFAAMPDSLCHRGSCERYRFTQARLLAARGHNDAAAAALAVDYVGIGPAKGALDARARAHGGATREARDRCCRLRVCRQCMGSRRPRAAAARGGGTGGTRSHAVGRPPPSIGRSCFGAPLRSAADNQSRCTRLEAWLYSLGAAAESVNELAAAAG